MCALVYALVYYVFFDFSGGCVSHMLFCTADALEIKKAEPKFRLELSGWRDLKNLLQYRGFPALAWRYEYFYEYSAAIVGP